MSVSAHSVFYCRSLQQVLIML